MTASGGSFSLVLGHVRHHRSVRLDRLGLAEAFAGVHFATALFTTGVGVGQGVPVPFVDAAVPGTTLDLPGLALTRLVVGAARPIAPLRPSGVGDENLPGRFRWRIDAAKSSEFDGSNVHL